MRADLEMVMDLLAKFGIDLRVRYIESALNPSDYFSREADKADWRERPACRVRCCGDPSSPRSLTSEMRSDGSGHIICSCSGTTMC
jgi:hypothetical protein